ncbi:signal peptidase I [Sphingomonas sp. M1-B02]|uniref:signal peptidase I n=1 Tax=Sphingomonas sp. M1-B02 TaxID=3114300 RepID=UPI00223F5D2B|nr:signal peptidase I [Sphingomonas sp. S6-11]UZK64983.1 signal peptidase I [Sphingomonas sp. S6-11]
MENAPPAEAEKPATDAPKPYSVGTATEKPKSEWRDLGTFLLKLAIIVFIVRSFIFSPFSIPSESMLPRLLIGDYLFITKWNYGYSKHSLPFSLPLIPGRIFPGTPERGDVVVFKAPPADNTDWIKRVIGLPGDTVQMVAGQLVLNGKPVPKQRVAQFILPITPNFERCDPQFLSADAQGKPVCSIPRFRETLPNGKTYDVLDQRMLPKDNTGVYTVPAGHVFLMGDNRDNSTDSRFSHDEGGIEFVPLENIQGKAVVSFWSTDGSANWLLPWTWFTAARWERLGEGF